MPISVLSMSSCCWSCGGSKGMKLTLVVALVSSSCDPGRSHGTVPVLAWPGVPFHDLRVRFHPGGLFLHQRLPPGMYVGMYVCQPSHLPCSLSLTSSLHFQS